MQHLLWVRAEAVTPEERMYWRKVNARNSADRTMLVTGRIWLVISLVVCLAILGALLYGLFNAESASQALLTLFLLVAYCGFFVGCWARSRDEYGQRPSFRYWITHP